ncbi:response regulator transcription factor [Alloyangia pacifica]|uniref:Two-component system, OmpR family, response regulator TctD n=1 Tax=Alloyangia pacifica TaxID=311180 RepID=A0A1I6UWM9_9RHOB|nr:response regulator transcription factor [Alloyangia pacifica]SDI28675.1 two-component system, OmpR family, response regulator TctD [Alloyangia pacifica]SFT05861.1 two-component system, OmpR family, response regulator TctD [Alloyangia pacifica]
MRILLVEDHEDFAATVAVRLGRDGHSVDVESDGGRAYALLGHKEFDLVLLDVNLPGRSGFEVLREMRLSGDDTPVLILTARSEVDDRILGLDTGADDFLVKPVDLGELAARCRMLGRRRAGRAQNVVTCRGFSYDRAARRATFEGRDIVMPARELQLLEIFLDHLGKVLTKEEVAHRLYTFDEAPNLNSIEQFVARLRRKLEGTPVRLQTFRGLGYMARLDDEA